MSEVRNVDEQLSKAEEDKIKRQMVYFVLSVLYLVQCVGGHCASICIMYNEIGSIVYSVVYQ